MTGETIWQRNIWLICRITCKGRIWRTYDTIWVIERMVRWKGTKLIKPYNIKILEGWGERICVKEILSWKWIPNHQLKTPSEKERFGTWIEWVGWISIWVEFNIVEVSSRVKAKTFGYGNVLFMSWYEEKEERVLVVNKVKVKWLMMR